MRTIIRFEPRLKASTLQIIPLQDERHQSGHNTLQFEIRGEILTQPYPMAFRVRSALDMEQSRITFFNTERNRWIHGYWNTTTVN